MISILEADSQARILDVLDSRSAEGEQGKSCSRSRGDAAATTLSLSTLLDPNVHDADLVQRIKGFLGGRRMKIKLRRLHGNGENSRCSDALVYSSGLSVAGDQPKCFSKRR